MEIAVEYFAVFGGLDVKVDTTKPLVELIEKHILKEYKHLRNLVSDITTGDALLHSILSASVLGDRRTNSSFKRLRISFDDGMDCVEKFRDLGTIKLERTVGDSYVSDKILLATPFLRFWFAFISPVFKGIRDGNFEEFHTNYENRKAQFADFVFDQLSHEFIKQSFSEDKIYNIGRYWDDERDIDLVAKTKSGKVIVGSCKYTNSKMKKSELTKLKENCESGEIKPDIYVLFAKKGYSSELKSLKSDTLLLFTCRNFKILIED
ncbi:DUF234 domain-containing protein [Sulfurospirillum arcachonense]|uniref:DUF234 domain-containing protein n=1 Tax=Sulfurospirillum arcachonense TaxID=57666 RepID=UPI000686050C|nr:DUF234 domain-containing protein [Sulfurospirillum arcachonense]